MDYEVAVTFLLQLWWGWSQNYLLQQQYWMWQFTLGCPTVCLSVCMWLLSWLLLSSLLFFVVLTVIPVLYAMLWHCCLGDRKGIQPVKSCVLVCWWWRFQWSFARLIAPVVTTTAITLSSNKIQNGDIVVPANAGPPGKWPLKRTEREIQRETESERETAIAVVMICWSWCRLCHACLHFPAVQWTDMQ